MTDSKELYEAIAEMGLKITYIASKIGITREGFYRKINNETEFKASEIEKLKNILNLSNERRDKIFFANNVE